MSKQRTEYWSANSTRLLAVVHEHVTHRVGDRIVLNLAANLTLQVYEVADPVLAPIRITGTSEDCMVTWKYRLGKIPT
jgi:hypothetical protein